MPALDQVRTIPVHSTPARKEVIVDHRTHRRWYRRLAIAACAPALGVVALVVPAAAQPASQQTPQTAYVDVSVATVWTSPSSPRPIDAQALTDPSHVRQWLSGMTVEQKRGLSGNFLTQTQVLYGHPVYVLQEKGDWVKVAVPDQPSPKNDLGYPGWIPKTQLTDNSGFAALREHRPFALVDGELSTGLYQDPALRHHELDVSINTRLPVLAQNGSSVLVATPDHGPAWMDADAVDVYDDAADIPTPTGADLVHTAKLFLDQPYLWGGRSGFGADCSGFTGTLYQVNGITIPRDAGPQALYGGATKVDRSDLRAGDLLFYANDNGTGSIYHVAMYVGDGTMIEAYDSATPVRVTRARFGTDYWGAVRYLS